MILLFDTNSELIRLLSVLKARQLVSYSFLIHFATHFRICLLYLTDDLSASFSHLDLKVVNSLPNISLMLLPRFCGMFSLKLL